MKEYTSFITSIQDEISIFKACQSEGVAKEEERYVEVFHHQFLPQGVPFREAVLLREWIENKNKEASTADTHEQDQDNIGSFNLLFYYQ